VGYDVGMDLDFLGIEYGLTVLQGAAPVYEWELLRGELALDVAGVTFGGEVAGVGDIVVEHVSGEKGVLRVHLPRLDAVGEFGYEVWYVAEGGERYRLVFGVVGVVESSALFAELAGLEVSHTRMALRMPECVGGHVQLVWRSVAGGGAATREAVDAAREAMAALEAARDFMASFEEAVSKAVRVDADGVLVIGNYWTGVRVKAVDGVTPHIGGNGNWFIGACDTGVPARGEAGLCPYIGADGNWCVGSVNTGVLARGIDGIDGDTVRRILVDTYEDIPQEGETCNGGFYYYVALGGTRTVATGWVRLSNGGVFSVGGVEIRASSAANAIELLAEVEEQTGVYAEVDSVIPTLVRLTALEAGVAGNRIKLETNDSRVTLSGAHLTGGTILNPTEWEMYAWLEGQGDLAGEWVRVGEVDDIATTRTYGMVKLSTDNKLSEGGIVGANESGRMLVSVSSSAVYGTGKLSGGTGVSGGGSVGMTADGAYMVEPAGYGKQGSMAFSVSGTVDVPAVGKLPNGAAGIRWATVRDGGAVVLADGMADGRAYAVPGAAVLLEYLGKNYLTVGDTWSREQVREYVKEGYVAKTDALEMEDVRKVLAGYESKADAEARVKAALVGYDSREVADGRYVRGVGVRGMEVVTLDKLPAPADQAKGVLYIAVL